MALLPFLALSSQVWPVDLENPRAPMCEGTLGTNVSHVFPRGHVAHCVTQADFGALHGNEITLSRPRRTECLSTLLSSRGFAPRRSLSWVLVHLEHLTLYITYNRERARWAHSPRQAPGSGRAAVHIMSSSCVQIVGTMAINFSSHYVSAADVQTVIN